MFVAPTLYDDARKGFLTHRIDVLVDRIGTDHVMVSAGIRLTSTRAEIIPALFAK